jgi:hypothetical protein
LVFDLRVPAMFGWPTKLQAASEHYFSAQDLRPLLRGAIIELPGIRAASMPAKEELHPGTQLELNLADYEVRGASMGHGVDGSRFACNIGPISDDALVALDRVARSHGTICLLLPKPLLLDLVTVERRDAKRVRIVGRICRPSRRE